MIWHVLISGHASSGCTQLSYLTNPFCWWAVWRLDCCPDVSHFFTRPADIWLIVALSSSSCWRSNQLEMTFEQDGHCCHNWAVYEQPLHTQCRHFRFANVSTFIMSQALVLQKRYCIVAGANCTIEDTQKWKIDYKNIDWIPWYSDELMLKFWRTSPALSNMESGLS